VLSPDKERGENEDAASRSRQLVGLVLVLLNQVASVASGELMQLQEKQGFNGPYFSVYFAHGVTGLCMFVAGAGLVWRHNNRTGQLKPTTIREQLLTGFQTPHEAFIASLVLVILWKYNCFWTAALPETSVTVFTAISQTACVIVMVLSVIFLAERVTCGKLGSVATCLAGVALVCLGSTHQPHHGGPHVNDDTTAMGCMWTVLCTVGVAVYCVEWGRRLGNANQMQVNLFLGLMGASSVLFLWPPLLLIGGPGLSYEPGQLLLPQGTAWQLVLANAGVSLVANFTLMLGMSFTSPLFIAIGNILQLPLSALADFVWHDKTPAAEEVAGYVCITIGFLVLVYEQHRPHPPQRPAVDETAGNSNTGVDAGLLG